MLTSVNLLLNLMRYEGVATISYLFIAAMTFVGMGIGMGIAMGMGVDRVRQTLQQQLNRAALVRLVVARVGALSARTLQVRKLE